MKSAAGSTPISIGVPLVPGEDTYAQGQQGQQFRNPRTLALHTGWTPAVLTWLAAVPLVPDYVSLHLYVFSVYVRLTRDFYCLSLQSVVSTLN